MAGLAGLPPTRALESAMDKLQTYINEHFQSELHKLVMSWINASLKVDGSYNPAGTKWRTYTTPAQDGAVTRASNKLTRAWKALNPKVVLVMFGEEQTDYRGLFTAMQGALKIAKGEQ